jgi:hypothetical protein
VGGGEDIRKRCRRVNVVEILYTHRKMRHVEAIPGMVGRRIKENNRGGKFNYVIL